MKTQRKQNSKHGHLPKGMVLGRITEYCKKCHKINDDGCCIVYENPEIQMRWAAMIAEFPTDPEVKRRALIMPGCNFNIHNIIEDDTKKQKVRIGQQKQKKKK